MIDLNSKCSAQELIKTRWRVTTTLEWVGVPFGVSLHPPCWPGKPTYSKAVVFVSKSSRV